MKEEKRKLLSPMPENTSLQKFDGDGSESEDLECEEFTDEDAENYVIEEELNICRSMIYSKLPKTIYSIINFLERENKTEKSINDTLREIVSAKETDTWILDAKKKFPVKDSEYEINLEDKNDFRKFIIWGMCNADKHVLDVLFITRHPSLVETAGEHVFREKIKDKIKIISFDILKNKIQKNTSNEHNKYLVLLLDILISKIKKIQKQQC